MNQRVLLRETVDEVPEEQKKDGFSWFITSDSEGGIAQEVYKVCSRPHSSNFSLVVNEVEMEIDRSFY